MTYRIAAVTVENFKRIRSISITPPADRHLLLIGGPNAQGKTSLLDAFTAALGGKKVAPADPVHHGAERSTIKLELTRKAEGDDPITLLITRSFKPDGTSDLEVREDGVRVRAPQDLLDEIIGERFLDPIAFLLLKAPEQRAELLKIIGDADKLADLEKRRARAFDQRRDVGRDLKKAEAELERTPEVTPGELVDVAGVTEQIRAIDAAVHARTDAERKADAAQAQVAALEKQVAALQDQLAQAEAGLMMARGRSEAAAAALAEMPAPDTKKREELTAKVRSASERNQKVAADIAAQKRRKAVEAEVAEQRAEVDKCEATLDKIAKAKADILAAAKLPVPGLGINDDGVTLNEIPLSQASGAERLRVAFGLAIAAAPHLGDVWMRDAALLDDNSLQLVTEMAAQHGVRAWLERVGNADPGAIIITDGAVVGAAEPAPAPALPKKGKR